MSPGLPAAARAAGTGLPPGSPRSSRRDWEERRRLGGLPALLAIMALHGTALWGAIQGQGDRPASPEPPPIMVGLIHMPAPPEASRPQPPPPRPKPRPPVRTEPKPQIVAAETTAPAAAEVPLPKPVPVVEPPPPQPTPPAPPAPVIPPNFLAAYLDNPAPAYPASARRMREKGTVLLRVVVATSGLPESVDLERSSGHERLDRAALDAVRKWKFVPARQGDTPIRATVLVPINFELTSS